MDKHTKSNIDINKVLGSSAFKSVVDINRDIKKILGSSAFQSALDSRIDIKKVLGSSAFQSALDSRIDIKKVLGSSSSQSVVDSRRDIIDKVLGSSSFQSALDINKDIAKVLGSSSFKSIVEKNIQLNKALGLNNTFDYMEWFAQLYDEVDDFSELSKHIYEESEKDEIVDGFKNTNEIAEAMKEQKENPKGFQEKAADRTESMKKQYYIVFVIICFIYNIIVEPYLQEQLGKPVMTCISSKIKELPEKNSKIIDRVENDTPVTIEEDVPYYYKIIYTDEYGNIKEGYVAKKNIKILEDIGENEGK